MPNDALIPVDNLQHKCHVPRAPRRMKTVLCEASPSQGATIPLSWMLGWPGGRRTPGAVSL